ncbi:MAG: DUF1499 domain-containing protein [Planctomycetota bacterium]
MKRKIIVVGIVSIVGMFMLSLSAARPANLGVSNGQLNELPESPNAVSSQTEDPSRRIEPIAYSAGQGEVINLIVSIIEDQPRTNIVSCTEDYVHAEYTSLIFRFVDDVEFYLDDNQKLIHFRSASRVGHSDLGTNQRRMEDLRNKITAKLTD